ncbi:MAG: hypothetical protein WCA63_05685 [Gallionella sp.]
MKFLKLTLIVFAIGFSANSNAIQFMGVPSCAEWVSRHSTNNDVSMEEWLLGFLSGLAAGKNIDYLKNADRESLFLWIDNYCKMYPLGRVDDGGHSLAEELSE